MPILNTEKKIKKIKLPSNDAEVEIYEGLVTADFLDLMGVNPKESILIVSEKLIKSWNFTDQNGAPLPVTQESIKLLPIRDLLVVLKESGLESISDEIKKNTLTN